MVIEMRGSVKVKLVESLVVLVVGRCCLPACCQAMMAMETFLERFERSRNSGEQKARRLVLVGVAHDAMMRR
jgi:hypothetical protein